MVSWSDGLSRPSRRPLCGWDTDSQRSNGQSERRRGREVLGGHLGGHCQAHGAPGEAAPSRTWQDGPPGEGRPDPGDRPRQGVAALGGLRGSGAHDVRTVPRTQVRAWTGPGRRGRGHTGFRGHLCLGQGEKPHTAWKLLAWTEVTPPPPTAPWEAARPPLRDAPDRKCPLALAGHGSW